MIKAGAGAGKTYGLIHKIVELVREYSQTHKGQLPRFVVTTFTRKATQEVRERLLAKALELRRTEPDFGELFLKFLKSSGLLMVSTIHGVLNQFLRQHGSTIGLDPDFKVVAKADRLLTEVLHGLLKEAPAMSELVKTFGWHRVKHFLLEHHRASILNPELRPLPEDVFFQYWQDQLQILRTATRDLRPLIEALSLKSKKSEALKGLVAGLSSIESILDTESSLWDKLNQLKDAFRNFPKNFGSMTTWDESAKDSKKIIYGILEELTDDLWTSRTHFEQHFQYQKVLTELAPAFTQSWFKKKIELGELELEDLELLSLYILRNFPQATKAFSESWNFWFIDEYQDTSPVQVAILEKLIGDCPHYVVGDPQQSIYFFRGARSKVFHEKLTAFSEAGARVETKKINRRSQTPTLYFINDLMDLVNKHQFTPMESLEEKKTPHLLTGHFYLVPKEEPVHFDGVVKVIENLLSEGVAPAAIAILCRENRELQKLYEHLQAAHLPAQISSQGHFLDDRAVRDALALWQFLVNPYDNTNLIELLRSPWFRVTDENLLTLSQRHKGPLWHELQQMDDPVVTQLREAIQRLPTLGHIEVWQQLILNSSALNDATARDPSGRKEGNLWKLIHHINEQSRQGTLKYTDPMDTDLQTDTNNENEARAIRESNQIQMMTIHASKGLEFDHILLPFLNHSRKKEGSDFWSSDLEGRFWSVSLMETDTRSAHPSFFAHKIAEEIHSLLAEESERLFYVAITRAKKTLHFFPPEDQEEISATGWARHLQDFVSKGIGRFQSDRGHYEFTIEHVNDLEHKPYNPSHSIPKPQQLNPYVGPSSSTPLNTTITALLQKNSQSEKINDSVDFDVSAIQFGLQAHRHLESFSCSRNLSLLNSDLQKFISTASVPLVEVMENGFAEWSFRIKLAETVIGGQIDLWGKDHQGNLWIIDYKTGASKYAAKAFQQLQLYAMALINTGHCPMNETIRFALCYLSEGKILTKIVAAQDLVAGR
jgi:ATP-dependent helicase/nuclease subunit A